jgi:hypothetical protein
MNAFLALEYFAWILSFIFGAWLLLDLVKTNTSFSEAVLMSSREGEIEDELIIDPTHRGTP